MVINGPLMPLSGEGQCVRFHIFPYGPPTFLLSYYVYCKLLGIVILSHNLLVALWGLSSVEVSWHYQQVDEKEEFSLFQ